MPFLRRPYNFGQTDVWVIVIVVNNNVVWLFSSGYDVSDQATFFPIKPKLRQQQ